MTSRGDKKCTCVWVNNGADRNADPNCPLHGTVATDGAFRAKRIVNPSTPSRTQLRELDGILYDIQVLGKDRRKELISLLTSHSTSRVKEVAKRAHEIIMEGELPDSKDPAFHYARCHRAIDQAAEEEEVR